MNLSNFTFTNTFPVNLKSNSKLNFDFKVSRRWFRFQGSLAVNFTGMYWLYPINWTKSFKFFQALACLFDLRFSFRMSKLYLLFFGNLRLRSTKSRILYWLIWWQALYTRHKYAVNNNPDIPRVNHRNFMSFKYDTFCWITGLVIQLGLKSEVSDIFQIFMLVTIFLPSLKWSHNFVTKTVCCQNWTSSPFFEARGDGFKKRWSASLWLREYYHMAKINF